MATLEEAIGYRSTITSCDETKYKQLKDQRKYEVIHGEDEECMW